MFDPLLQYVQLRLSDSLANQVAGTVVAVNGGTVFVDQPGRFKTNSLLFTGLTTGTLTIPGAAGMIPGADVEATAEMFIRPSALGGADQVVATWGTALGTALRVVIRGGRFRLEAARDATGAWDTFPGVGPLVLWDEWQFFAVIQEVDPVRKYALYVGTSGTATLAGEVLDPGASPSGGFTSPTMRMAAWSAASELREFHASSVIVRDNAMVWTGNLITLGCAAPAAGTFVSILVSGDGVNYPAGTHELGGTIGAGQTVRDFVDAVVIPNITAHMGAYPQSVVVSQIVPLGGTSENYVTINWGGQRTITVAPIGTLPVRFRGNVSELRVTTIRRRYFDPFSTPPNQPVAIPDTSWDGGGAATLARALPSPLISAAGGPGTSAVVVVPKMTLAATVTQGATSGGGTTEVGTSLVLRDPATSAATVSGVSYTWPFRFAEPGAAEVAVASTSRSTGKWYFEVTSLNWFIAGVVSPPANGIGGADIGFGASVGYGVSPSISSAGIFGDGAEHARITRPDPNGYYSAPTVGTVGILFDADAKTFETFQETLPGTVAPSVDRATELPAGPMDVSAFMSAPFFPAVRAAEDNYGAGGAAITVNFGATPFAFPSVPGLYGALPFDTRPLTPTVVGARAASTMPSPTVSVRMGAHAEAHMPALRSTATAAPKQPDEALLTLPGIALSARSGHSAALTSPALIGSATGTVVAVASLATSVPALRLSAAGRVSDQAAAFLRMRAFSVISYGGGSAAASAPALRAAGSATAGSVAHARASVPIVVLRAAATREDTVRAALTLPAMRITHPWLAVMRIPGLNASASVSEVYPTAGIEAYAVNLRRPLDENPRNQYEAKNPQVTRYTDFPFTHIVRFGDDYYGAAEGGLYRIGGDTDAGTPVTWDFEMCTTDFGASMKKNVYSVYLGGTLPPTVEFTIKSGETVDQTHVDVVTNHSVTRNYRQTFGRGRQARYYGFGFAGSGPLELDAAEFAIATSTRRI